MSGVISFFEKAFSSLGKIFGFGGSNWVFAVLTLLSMFTKKKKQVQQSTTESIKESPTYGWDSVQTTSAADAPIPLIFGKHPVGGNIVNTYIETKLITQTNGAELANITVTPAETIDLTNKLFNRVYSFNSGSYSNLQFPLYNSFNEAQYTNQRQQGRDINGNWIGYNNNIIETKSLGVNYYIKKSTDTDYTRVYPKTMTVKAIPVNSISQLVATTNSVYSRNAGASYVQQTLPALDVTLDANTNYQIKVEFVYNNNYFTQYVNSGWNGYTLHYKPIDMDYIGIGAPSYITPSYAIGTGELSAQTLKIDVVLGSGRLKSTEKLYVNDQLSTTYNSDNPNTGAKTVRVIPEYRYGNELLPETNQQDTLQMQSSPFTVNQVINRTVFAKLIEASVAGANYLVVDNNAVFATGTLCVGNGWSFTVTGTEGANKIYVSPNVPSVVPVDTTFYVDSNPAASMYSKATDAYGYYTDFTYVTQQDYVDKLDLGLNAPSGLFTFNQTTGANDNATLEFAVYIAHDEDMAGVYTLAKFKEKAFYINPVKATSNKKQKIWLNVIADKLPASAAGNKKYAIKVRRLTQDPYDSNTQSALQIAFVEEIKNNDVYYNDVAYCSMAIPADSRLNGGNPKFKFIVNGLRVPVPMPANIIQAGSSTTSKIVTTHLFNNINGQGVTVNPDYENYELNEILELVTPTIDNPIASIREEQIVTMHFLCNGRWYKRYCLLHNTFGATPTFDIQILTPEYINTISGDSQVQNLLKWGVMYKDLLFMENTALPAIPTDMFIEVFSKDPSGGALYLLTNKANALGRNMDDIDTDSFREAYLHFREYIANPLKKGTFMHRCELNYVIDTSASVRSHLDKIMNICHAALYNIDGKIRIIVDKKQAVPVCHIDEDADIIVDSLKVTTLDEKDLPNQIIATYLNEDSDYKKDPMTVEDTALLTASGYEDIRKLEMEMYGATCPGQVFAECLRLIKTARYTRFVISFNTALTALKLDINGMFTLTAPTYGWNEKKFKCMNIKKTSKQECEVEAVEYFDELYEITDEDLLNYKEPRHTDMPNYNQIPAPLSHMALEETDVRLQSGDIQINLSGTFDVESTTRKTTVTANALTVTANVADNATAIPVKIVIPGMTVKTGDSIIIDNIKYTVASLSNVDTDNGLFTINILESAFAITAGAYVAIEKLAPSQTEYDKFSYAMADVYKKEFKYGKHAPYAELTGTTINQTAAITEDGTYVYELSKSGSVYQLIKYDYELNEIATGAVNYSVTTSAVAPTILLFQDKLIICGLNDGNYLIYNKDLTFNSSKKPINLPAQISVGKSVSTTGLKFIGAVAFGDILYCQAYSASETRDMSYMIPVYCPSGVTGNIDASYNKYYLQSNYMSAVFGICGKYARVANDSISQTLFALVPDNAGGNYRNTVIAYNIRSLSILQPYTNMLYGTFDKMLKPDAFVIYGNYRLYTTLLTAGYGPANINNAYDLKVAKGYLYVACSTINGDDVALIKQFTANGYMLRVLYDVKSASTKSLYGTAVQPLSALADEAVYSVINLDTGVKTFTRARAVDNGVPVTTAPEYIWKRVQANIKIEGTEFVINGLADGEYRVDIKPVSANGKIGSVYAPELTAPENIIALTGAKLPPSDVTGFAGGVDTHDKRIYKLYWNAVTDSDLSHYALHVYSKTGENIVKVEKLAIDKKTTAYTYTLSGDYTYEFNLRAVNKNGKFSENPAILTETLSIKPDSPVIVSLTSEFNNADFPLLLKLSLIGNDAITGYKVTITYGLTSQVVGIITSDTMRIRKEGLVSEIQNANGPVTVSVVSINKYGIESTPPATANITINGQPNSCSAVEVYQDKLGNISTRFNKPANSQDILYYSIRYGESEIPANCTNVKTTTANNITLFKADNALHNKVYYVHVQSVNKVGITSAWASGNMTIKTIPSIVTGLLSIPKGNSLSLKWNENNEICFDRFEAFIGTAADFTPAPENKIWKGTSTQIPINQMPDGTALVSGQSYTVKLRAVSSVNETYVSAVTSITQSTADTVPPALTLLSTVPDILKYGVINGNALTVNVSASDNIGIQAVKGRVYIIGSAVPELIDFTLNAGVYSHQFGTLADGEYQLEVRAIDTAGNATPLYRNFDIDTVKATAPTSVTATQQTGNVIVTVNADLPKYFSDYEYYYATSEDNITWSNYTLLTRTKSSYINADLPISAYTKYGVKICKIHDAALKSDMTESSVVYVDKIAPTIKVTASPNIFEKFTLLPSNTITFNFELYDEGGMDVNNGFKVYMDGIESAVVLSSTDNKNYTGTITYNTLANGVHTFSAKAVDNYFNSRESANYTFEVDLELPAVLSVFEVRTQGKTVTLKCTTSPATIKNFKGFSFYYSTNDGVNRTAILPAFSATGQASYTFSTDLDKVCFAVDVTKMNGVKRPSTDLQWTSNYKIDTTPPVISSFSISGISNGYINKAAKDSGVNLTYAATDSNSGLAGVYYTKDNGVNWTVLSASPTAITSELSTDGVYNYQLKAIDNSGNIAYSDVITFTVDTVAPTAVTGMNGVIRLNNEINFNASSASDIEGYEIKYGGANYGDATLLTKIVNNQTSGVITYKWLATSGTTLKIRVKAIDKAGNYSDESYADIATTIPASPTGLSGTGTFNGVNFWWNNVTTDNNSIYTDDISGYQYDAYIDSIIVDNKIASAIFTKTNNATVMIPDAKKDGKTHNVIIVLNTINKWGSASSGVNLSKAIIRIEAVDMGSNPMQYDVISMEGGNTPLKNTPNLLKLIDGTDDTFVTEPSKCKLLLDDLVDLTSGQVPIGYATATKTADGRFTSGTDLSVTVRGSHYGDKFGKSIAVEESRTNLFLYNNELTNGAWGKDQCDVTYDSMLDNNGTKLFKVTCNTVHQIMLRQYIPVTQGVTYTVSAFIRNIDISNASNLTIGASGCWSNTIPISNKVSRVSFTFTATATESKHFGILSQGNLSIGQSFLCSLPQVEVGSFATSAIKTEGTAVTRPAGNCYFNNPLNTLGDLSISFWWKPDFSYNDILDTYYAHCLELSDIARGNMIQFGAKSTGVYLWHTNGAQSNTDLYSFQYNKNTNYHIGIDIKDNVFKLYLNGVFVGTGATINTRFQYGLFRLGSINNNIYVSNSVFSNIVAHNKSLTADEYLQIYNAGLDGDKVILK